MMKLKPIMFAFALFAPTVASAQTATPRMLFEKIAQPVMERNPSINEFEICIENDCETFFQSDIPVDRSITGPRNPGAAVDPGQVGGVADAVGTIVASAAKSVGVGGRVAVDYEKKADGSIKVRVEASFGTGAGAAAGAGASNPDNGASK